LIKQSFSSKSCPIIGEEIKLPIRYVMPRSVRVKSNRLTRVRNALISHGFSRQIDLAEAAEMSLDTVNNFLTGDPVAVITAIELCHHLNQSFEDTCEIITRSGKTEPAEEPLNPPFYVEIQRQPQEAECLKEILRPGSFLRIKGPQNMGKTRLLNRLLDKVKEAKQDNCKIVIINWQDEFDSTAFNTYEQFLENFCAAISKHLELLDNLDKYWNRKGSPSNKTTGYLSDSLLPQIESQLILVLEEMDRVFDHEEISQDFCVLLRGWSQKSARNELWQKLSLVIVHSTDKYASLDLPTSPLANVGVTVAVEELSHSEVENLVKKYGLSLTSELEQLITLVKHHPFLLNHAFKKIAQETTNLEEILVKAATQESIYREYLLELGNIFENNPDLKENFKKVVTASEPVRLNPNISFKLERRGLIRVIGDLAEPRCPLYRQYFAKYL
jgi:serine/threonine-protein kinase